MHSDKQNRNIQRQIEKITDVIEKVHIDIDLIISETEEKISGLSKKYLPEFAKEQERLYKESARQSAVTIREDAVEDINLAFDEIRASVVEWVSTPVPEGIANLIGNIRNNALQLSSQELLALSEQARGSYFAMRSLSALANEQRLNFPNYEKLDNLSRMITIAENSCRNAVNYYSGSLAEGGHLATWLLPDEELLTVNTSAMAAQFFEQKDSSFWEMTERLLTLTDPAVSLLPSERDRIKKLFARCETEDQKVERMLKLIEDPHTDKTDIGVLKMFDEKLYTAALKLKKDNTRIAAKAVEDAVREKQIEAMKARTSAQLAAAQLADAQQ